MKCTKCNGQAVTHIRYNGTNLCKNHFEQYVEKRVHKDVRKQSLRPGIMAVALSGGKDSLAVLYLMHDIIKSHRDKEVYAITVDEGIDGYRSRTIERASHHCQLLGVPHHIISFKDAVGHTLDQISTKRGKYGECTYCGVFRRMCLNTAAKEIGASSLIMGHNLDDVAQSVLMNLFNNGIERMARMAPHNRKQPGLVPRLVPLRNIPEKEVKLYALLQDIDVLEDECPYALRATRGLYQELLAELEDIHPGTRHSILQSYLTLEPCLHEMFQPAHLHNCRRCNEPSSQDVCRACRLLDYFSIGRE